MQTLIDHQRIWRWRFTYLLKMSLTMKLDQSGRISVGQMVWYSKSPILGVHWPPMHCKIWLLHVCVREWRSASSILGWFHCIWDTCKRGTANIPQEPSWKNCIPHQPRLDAHSAAGLTIWDWENAINLQLVIFWYNPLLIKLRLSSWGWNQQQWKLF